MPAIAKIKFQIGQSYATRSAVDADTVHSYKIERRTEKSVWFIFRNELTRRVIRVGDDGVEMFDPYGRYSMSPVISADRTEHDVLMGRGKQHQAPALRAYQQRALAMVVHRSELVPQPTRASSRAVEALKASADIVAAATDETKRFAHATEFVSRFITGMGKSVHRDQVQMFLDLISMMNGDDFDDLDLIRQYLRGE